MYATAIALEGRMETVPAMILCCIQRTEPTGHLYSWLIHIPGGAKHTACGQRAWGWGSCSDHSSEEVRGGAKVPSRNPRRHGDPRSLLPLGFPADGVEYGPTRRRPVREVATPNGGGAAWRPVALRFPYRRVYRQGEVARPGPFCPGPSRSKAAWRSCSGPPATGARGCTTALSATLKSKCSPLFPAGAIAHPQRAASLKRPPFP